ncbi:hypothetical protein J3A83DRAFT_4184599 [Scleroderma citrinum]
MAISADTTNSVIQLMAGTGTRGGYHFLQYVQWGSPHTAWQGQYNSPNGAAATDSNNTHFVIDNATISFSLHCMDDTACIKMYDTKSLKTYPKQVTFAEKGRAIVGSSDNRIVHIFNKVNGDLLQLLQHSKSGKVQTIAQQQQQCNYSLKEGYQGHKQFGEAYLGNNANGVASDNATLDDYHGRDGAVPDYVYKANHLPRDKVDSVWYILESSLDEDVIHWVLVQELAAKNLPLHDVVTKDDHDMVIGKEPTSPREDL